MAPVLPDWLGWVWRAWHELHAERHHTVQGVAVPMGAVHIVSRPGHIPWRAVRAWCAHHRIGPDRMAMLLRLIRAMDEAYVAWWQDQQPKGGGAG